MSSKPAASDDHTLAQIVQQLQKLQTDMTGLGTGMRRIETKIDMQNEPPSPWRAGVAVKVHVRFLKDKKKAPRKFSGTWVQLEAEGDCPAISQLLKENDCDPSRFVVTCNHSFLATPKDADINIIVTNFAGKLSFCEVLLMHKTLDIAVLGFAPPKTDDDNAEAMLMKGAKALLMKGTSSFWGAQIIAETSDRTHRGYVVGSIPPKHMEPRALGLKADLLVDVPSLGGTSGCGHLVVKVAEDSKIQFHLRSVYQGANALNCATTTPAEDDDDDQECVDMLDGSHRTLQDQGKIIMKPEGGTEDEKASAVANAVAKISRTALGAAVSIEALFDSKSSAWRLVVSDCAAFAMTEQPTFPEMGSPTSDGPGSPFGACAGMDPQNWQ